MPLDRMAVIETALVLLDEVGWDGLTVRRLAERLGVQNPALYWHFKNKKDLLNGIAEVIIADAYARFDLPNTPDSWPDWLEELAQRFHGALISHRDGARVIASADLANSQHPVMFDRGLHVLISAGFDLHTAFAGMITIFDFATGSAFEEQAEQNHDDGNYHSLPDPNRLPHLSALFSEFTVADRANRSEGFTLGIKLIINGLRSLL